MLTRRGSCSHCVPASDHQGALCVSQLVNYTPIKPKHNKGRWDPETLSGPTPGFPRVQCEPHSRLSCSSCPLVSTTGTSAALQAEGTRQTRGERRPWASVRCSAPHPPGAPPPARLPPLRVAPSPLKRVRPTKPSHKQRALGPAPSAGRKEARLCRRGCRASAAEGTRTGGSAAPGRPARFP